MIDWISFDICCKHDTPIVGGHFMKVEQDGSVESCWSRKRRVRGSHESSIEVKTSCFDDVDGATRLRVDGNPLKWLQGHNVYGTDDLHGLVVNCMQLLCDILDLSPTDDDYRSWLAGEYDIKRVDINYSFELANRNQVMTWLSITEKNATTRHGRCKVKGGTNYWGKNSRRWSLKAYSKALEIEQKKNLPEVFMKGELPNWMQNKLRIELTLRVMELNKLKLSRGSDWNDDTVNRVYNQYLSRIQISENMKMTQGEIDQLPKRLQVAFLLWDEGHDLRKHYPKNTFYRHRRELLKFGIDISIVQESNRPDTTNVVPLVQVLKAKPAMIPDWAYTDGSYYQPRKKTLLDLLA